MKKMLRSLTPCLLGFGIILTSVGNPVAADPPPKKMAEFLGYKYALPDLSDKQLQRAPQDKWYIPPSTSTVSEKDKADARDFLTPRLYQKPESSSLIPMLLKLYQKQPDSAKIARKLALTCLQGGQPREALYWFTKTFQLDRADLSALWNMATLSYRLGDLDKAYAFLGEYARLDPYSAWGRIAQNFQKTGKYGGYEMSTTFQKNLAKTGTVEAGGGSSGESLMIIDGRATTLEDMVPSYQPLTSNPLSSPGQSMKSDFASPQKGARKTETYLPTKPKKSINRAEIESTTVEPQQYKEAPPEKTKAAPEEKHAAPPASATATPQPAPAVAATASAPAPAPAK